MLKVDHTGINQIILICNGSSYIQSPKNVPKLSLWNDSIGAPHFYSTFHCEPGEYLIGFRYRMDNGKTNAFFSTATFNLELSVLIHRKIQTFKESSQKLPFKGATDIHMMCSDGKILKGDSLDWFKPASHDELKPEMIFWGEWQNWKYCARPNGISGLRGQFEIKSGLVNTKFKCKKFKKRMLAIHSMRHFSFFINFLVKIFIIGNLLIKLKVTCL